VVKRSAAVLLAGIGFLPGQPAGISLLQTQLQLPGHYGDYLAGTQQLEPSLWFPPTGTLAGLPGGGVAGLPQEQGSDGFISGAINAALLDPSDQIGIGTGPTGSGPAAAESLDDVGGYGCEQAPGQVRTGGQYWNGQTSLPMPAVLAPNAPGDPVEGPNGDPSNLLGDGRAGGWCRPHPLPFADSSPMARRNFWLALAILLTGSGLFVPTRGVRLQSH
jgi:hypothetical protein